MNNENPLEGIFFLAWRGPYAEPGLCGQVLERTDPGAYLCRLLDPDTGREVRRTLLLTRDLSHKMLFACWADLAEFLARHPQRDFGADLDTKQRKEAPHV